MRASRTVPAAPARDRAHLVAPLACALAASVVFHRALAYSFSQDDFLGLARASGLAPRLSGPWRWLSHQGFFDGMRAIAGLDALPYHAVSLVAHVVTVIVLWTFLARRAGAPAATVGAAFFAVHPSLFTALYWISAVGDVLALMFALSALLLIDRREPWRWLAVPLFALSLLSKESTLFLPLALLAGTRLRPASRDPVVIALVVVAALDLVALVAGNAFGMREGVATAAPYAFGWGGHMWQNALTYLGWTANFILPTVRGFGDAIDPDVYGWGLATLAIGLIGLFVRSLRDRGWGEAVALWVALILPLLPLMHHAYHYYLYAPLAAVAWCLAAASDVLFERVRSALVPWLVGSAVLVLLAANAFLLVSKIEHAPLTVAELRSDPTVDRARIAGNVIDGLKEAALPPGVALRFWSPQASSIGPRGEPLGGPAPQATYWEYNVRQALLDGLAVRVMFPMVTRVEFVRAFDPAPDDVRWAVYRPEGKVQVWTTSGVDSILRRLAPPDSSGER